MTLPSFASFFHLNQYVYIHSKLLKLIFLCSNRFVCAQMCVPNDFILIKKDLISTSPPFPFLLFNNRKSNNHIDSQNWQKTTNNSITCPSNPFKDKVLIIKTPVNQFISELTKGSSPNYTSNIEQIWATPHPV